MFLASVQRSLVAQLFRKIFWQFQPPTEGDSGKALVANQDGSTEWGHSVLSDDELLSVFIDADIIAGVADASGAILTDENGKILLM